MLIADGFASGRANQMAGEVQRQVVALVEAGLSFVQLRDHAASASLFEETAGHLVECLRTMQEDVIITINSRARTAHELGCGLHIGKQRMKGATEFVSPSPSGGNALRCGVDHAGKIGVGGRGEPVGYSAHSLEGFHRASAGFDYATFSPIFSTRTHPEAVSAGIEALAEVCAAVPGFPVYALGGLTPERTEACLRAAAYGVAVLSDLLDAANPVERLASYHEAGVL
ncbi:MAG: thiamine phosphate synthase [Bacteroidetes bacterium]|nr:thiamine phosphate synthase [Bacteroidota bacterium]